jgi:hypothetical protein
LVLMERWPQLRSRDTNFPQSAGQFGRKLKARADALAARGVTVRRTAVKGTDYVELCLICDEPSERPAGTATTPPVPPAEPCPGCGGSGWWRADQTRGEWCCRGCEPMPLVVSNLQEWPLPQRH